MWLVISLYVLPLARLASWRATTVMRSSSQSPMSRLWEKNSPVFLPPLQPGSSPAFGSIASTPQWRVGRVGLPHSPHAPDQPFGSSVRNIPTFLLCQMIHLKLGQGDWNFPKWQKTSLGNIYLRSTFSDVKTCENWWFLSFPLPRRGKGNMWIQDSPGGGAAGTDHSDN